MASIQGIYVALFGRPADPAGLAYFNAQTQSGLNLTAIGDLASTAEYQDRFSGMTNEQIVNSIYQSLFERDGEADGIEFFVSRLENGTYNINNIAIAILDGAQGDDLATVNAKIAAANLFTEHLNQQNEIDAYAGEAAAEIGRDFINGVNMSDAGTEAEADAAILLLLDQQGGQGPGGDGDGNGNPGGGADTSPFYTLAAALAEPALPAEYRLTLDPGNPENLNTLDVAEAKAAANIVANANNGLDYSNTTGYDYDLEDSASAILAESGTATVHDAGEVIALGTGAGVADDLDFSTFSRGVTINARSGDDNVKGSAFGDVINAGAGNDTIDGGDGLDYINLTEPVGTPNSSDNDRVVLATSNSSKDTIVGFDMADDYLVVSDADVTASLGVTINGAEFTTYNAGPYNTTNSLAILNSDGVGILEFNFNMNGGDLSASTDGSELFDGLSAPGALTSLNAQNGDWSGFLIAYQNNTAYVYFASSADGEITADEVALVAEVQGIGVGGLSQTEFLVA